MHELGVDMIFAKTHQAKGRIERLWFASQSRLPVEFAKRAISKITEANSFLEEYRFIYNKKFSVTPESDSLFIPFNPDFDIDDYLCIKHTRKTDYAGTFSFKNRCFQILDEGFPIIFAHREIQVLVNPRFEIRVQYKGKTYDIIRYLKPQNKNVSTKVTEKTIHNVTPHLVHSSDEWRKIWWAEDYILSLKFSYELFFENQQSAS